MTLAEALTARVAAEVYLVQRQFGFREAIGDVLLWSDGTRELNVAVLPAGTTKLTFDASGLLTDRVSLPITAVMSGRARDTTVPIGFVTVRDGRAEVTVLAQPLSGARLIF